MSAMIHNDIEKEWMMPLLEMRNLIDFRTDEKGEYSANADRHLRDFRRMSRQCPIDGKWQRDSRTVFAVSQGNWLGRLLRAQVHIQRSGPPEVKNIQLITMEELQEIRRIWVVDKHEIEDSLPRIYREATGKEFPGQPLDDNLVLGEMEMRELEEICGGDRLHYELTRELLSLTRQQRTRARRAGLFALIEKTFSRHFYDSREDAFGTGTQDC